MWHLIGGRMERDIRIFGLRVTGPEEDTVMGLLDCRPDNPVYEEMKDAYDSLYDAVRMRIRPKAAFVFDEITEENEVLKVGAKVLYCILTIGGEVSKLSAKYFEEGDYVNGMLVDAMADSCLFSLDKEVIEKVKLLCKEEKVGVLHRFEAPQEIRMEIQKTAYDALNAKQTLNLDITSGFMYDPVKSLCQVFELTDDTSFFQTKHDCTQCDKIDCPVRKVYENRAERVLTILAEGEEKKIPFFSDEKLTTLLEQNDIYMSKPCGGNGKCGKCKVVLKEGILAPSKEDLHFFSEEELLSGLRLACTSMLTGSCTISMADTFENGFHVVAESGLGVKHEADQEFGYAIDIGTTTIAISLCGLQTQTVIDTYTTMNRQRTFGADVIARMQASNTGKKEQLQESIQQDLLTGIRQLADQYGIKESQIQKITIAGNTTMLHLLMGYSCETLGVYPFDAVNLKRERRSFAEVFADPGFANTQIELLPGISTFVGADITAGLFACGFSENEKMALLVDLGTNGEMAIGSKERILVTSTAAGPAFEGGNIEWGTGSIDGAIYSVKIEDGQTTVATIGDRPPIGICGTGIIAGVFELVEHEIVSFTGMMEEDWHEDGYPLAKTQEGEQIVISQKDIREIQLAKSAIRAGIETLILRSELSYDDIDEVFLAGGFGYHIELEKAVSIGMIPEELSDKITAAGNTSLKGALKALFSEENGQKMTVMAEQAVEISLASDLDFQDFYMEHMMFGEE